MNKVYVKWNPFQEKVVCVHTDEYAECDKCTEESENLKGTPYLVGDWFEVCEKKTNQESIIDDAYKNFKNSFPIKKSNPPEDYINSGGQLLTKEEFINKIKTDDGFAKKWGLKIEERELSLEERVDYFNSKMIKEGIRTQIGTVGIDESYWGKALEETNHDIPTREITVTYNNEKLEFYE